MSGTTDSAGSDPAAELPSQVEGHKVLYVMPAPVADGTDDTIDVTKYLRIIWSGRWLLVLIVSAFTVAGAAYAFLATTWYQAKVTMVPVKPQAGQGLPGQFGGLADIVGLRVGGTETVEPMAVLRSRDFAHAFIDDLNLVTVLLADEWDAERGRWKGDDPADWPDARDAVTYFHKKVMSVDEDRKTGVVTLTIRWKSPVEAAKWGNLLAARLNARMRQQTLDEAAKNIEYLKRQLAEATVVSLQNSISRVLEVEMQKLMLAQGNQDFSYRISDHAEVPREHFRPKRLLLILFSVLLGVIVGVAVVGARAALSSRVRK